MLHPTRMCRRVLRPIPVYPAQSRATGHSGRLLASGLALAFATSLAAASVPSQEAGVEVGDVQIAQFVRGVGQGSPAPTPRGAGCVQQSSTRANFNFDNIQPGVQATIQAGLIEGEIAAQTYSVPAGDFPIRIDMLQTLLGSVSTQGTTTRYTWLVWEGVPSATNPPVYSFSSSDDGIDPPNAVTPPAPGGTQAAVVDLRFMVDPGAPLQDQMVLTNPSGANSFTIGIRIDEHNNQTGDGCGAGQVPQASNAFPMTEFGNCCSAQLTSPTQNHLFAVPCPLACPAGWSRFDQLVQGFCFSGTCIDGCRPSGDWLLRATWTSLACGPALGACCLSDGSCTQDTLLGCDTVGGIYIGDNIDCADANCPVPTGACCIPSTQGCLDAVDAELCGQVGGVFQGNGVLCSQIVCFAMGACCLPDGSCIGPVSPEDCEAQSGVFQGDATNCASTNCPQPTGACCVPATGACVLFTQANCNVVGGTWQGAGTTCADANMNGTADLCEQVAPPCPCDRNLDTFQTVADFFSFLNDFNAQLNLANPQGGSADFDESGFVTPADFFAFLNGCLGAVSIPNNPCP